MVQSRVELSKTDLAETTREIPIQILYVDDDASFLKTAGPILEMQGEFQVDTALSVEEVWEKMEKEEYDIVVSDYQMPGKDGLQFLKELREKGNSIPFFLFTGKGREEVAIKALNLGADGYFNKHGEPETVYGELAHGIRQVVDKRRAEHSFLKSEYKYRRLVETLHEGIWAIDKDSRTTFVNPRMAEILGYDTEEMKGRHLFSFMDERGVEIAKSLLERRKQNIKEQHDFEFLRKDGTRVYATLETTPITDDNGNYSGALASVMDTTERKKAEEKVERSSEELRRTFDAISDFVFVLDKDQRFVRVNKAVCDFLKKEPEELIGKHCYEALHGTDEPLQNCPCREMSLTKKAVTTEVDDPNSGLIFLMTVSPFLDDKGEHMGCVHVAKDITQRRRSERELFDERMKLQNIFSASPDAIVVIDLSANIIECNERALKMLQYSSKEEVIGKSAITFLATKEQQRATHSLENTLKNGLTKDIEYTAVSKDGHELPIELSASVVKDVSGKPVGFVTIIRDITERKKTEELARASEERYRSYIEVTGQLAWTTNANGEVEEDIPAWRKFTGQSHEEVKGWGWTKALHPDDLEHTTQVWEKAVATKNGYEVEYRIRRHDGVYRYFLGHGVPVFNEDGSLREWVGTCIDVTERKRSEEVLRKSEEELRESENKFRTIFEGANEGILVVDPNTLRFVIANPAISSLIGYTEEELLQLKVEDIHLKKDLPRVLRILEMLSREKAVFSEAVPVLRKDGRIVFCDISDCIVKIGKQELEIGFFRDVTERKKMEERLKEINKRLEITNEKLHVVGGLTRHDVRNKLSAVTGNAYLLRRTLAGNAEALEHLADMENAVRNVEVILEFTRTYEKLGVEKLVHMDVGKAVDEAASLFTDLKGVKIVNECGGLTVLADSLLSQLFYNLLDNSLKHGEKVSQIRVHHEEGKNGLKLSYEDDGVGVPQATKPKLFVEGYTTGKGSGYGLYLVKRMIEVYGWAIQEKGTPSQGIKFVMTIPKTNPNGKENYVVGR